MGEVWMTGPRNVRGTFLEFSDRQYDKAGRSYPESLFTITQPPRVAWSYREAMALASMEFRDAGYPGEDMQQEAQQHRLHGLWLSVKEQIQAFYKKKNGTQNHRPHDTKHVKTVVEQVASLARAAYNDPAFRADDNSTLRSKVLASRYCGYLGSAPGMLTAYLVACRCTHWLSVTGDNSTAPATTATSLQVTSDDVENITSMIQEWARDSQQFFTGASNRLESIRSNIAGRQFLQPTQDNKQAWEENDDWGDEPFSALSHRMQKTLEDGDFSDAQDIDLL